MMSSFERSPDTGARGDFVATPFGAAGRDSQAGFLLAPAVPAASGEPAPEPEPSLEEQLAQARAEGYAAGRAELPWTEAEALRAVVAQLEEAGHSLAELRRGYLRGQRRAVVELALSVAEHWLRARIETDVDALVPVVERSLEVLQEADDEPVSLRLAPDQHRLLEQGLAERLSQLARRAGLRIEADPSLAAGDVRVVAGRSQVDGRLAEMLRRVADSWAELVELPEETARPQPEDSP